MWNRWSNEHNIEVVSPRTLKINNINIKINSYGFSDSAHFRPPVPET